VSHDLTHTNEDPAGATRPGPSRVRRQLAPVHGVTLDQYAEVAKRLASHGYDPATTGDIAEELGIPLAVWKRARAEWDRRLVSDPEVAAEFSRSYKSR